MDSAIKEISKKDNFLKHLQSSNLKVASESLASDGLKALEGLEFPKTSSEDWKYTRTGRISKLQFAAEVQQLRTATEAGERKYQKLKEDINKLEVWSTGYEAYDKDLF